VWLYVEFYLSLCALVGGLPALMHLSEQLLMFIYFAEHFGPAKSKIRRGVVA